MDIKSCLIIEDNNQGHINLFAFGSFVQVYNQSFYLLTEQLNHSLIAVVKNFKSVGNRFVIYGGFPISKVALLYPDAVKTDWDFQLSTLFELDGYNSWLVQWQARAR